MTQSPQLPPLEPAALRAWLVRQLSMSEDQVELFVALVNEFERQSAPVELIMFCPMCHERHIDVALATKPHKEHACQTCGFCWKPARRPTVGVAFLSGYKDPPPGMPPSILEILSASGNKAIKEVLGADRTVAPSASSPALDRDAVVEIAKEIRRRRYNVKNKLGYDDRLLFDRLAQLIDVAEFAEPRPDIEPPNADILDRMESARADFQRSATYLTDPDVDFEEFGAMPCTAMTTANGYTRHHVVCERVAGGWRLECSNCRCAGQRLYQAEDTAFLFAKRINQLNATRDSK